MTNQNIPNGLTSNILAKVPPSPASAQDVNSALTPMGSAPAFNSLNFNPPPTDMGNSYNQNFLPNAGATPNPQNNLYLPHGQVDHVPIPAKADAPNVANGHATKIFSQPNPGVDMSTQPVWDQPTSDKYGGDYKAFLADQSNTAATTDQAAENALTNPTTPTPSPYKDDMIDQYLYDKMNGQGLFAIPKGAAYSPDQISAIRGAADQHYQNVIRTKYQLPYYGLTGSGNSNGTQGQNSVDTTSPNYKKVYGGFADLPGFNPGSSQDSDAFNLYRQVLMNNGKIPSNPFGKLPGAQGGMRLNAAENRLNNLGVSLPTGQDTAGTFQAITKNKLMLNNLTPLQNTIEKNYELLMKNVDENHLNTSGLVPLNNIVNALDNMRSNPDTAQLFAQNTTLQNELGNLLAARSNQTTVHDKLTSEGLIQAGYGPKAIRRVFETLLKESRNQTSSVRDEQEGLYGQVDPYGIINRPAPGASQKPTSSSSASSEKGGSPYSF